MKLHRTSIGAELLGGTQPGGDVVDVVQPIEGADHAESVRVQPLHPGHDHVIGQKIERGDVPGAKEGAKLGVRRELVSAAHPLPRILLQVAHGHIELDRRHEVDLLKADLVEVRSHLLDVFGPHARRPDALMRITQRGVDDLDFAPAAGWSPAHAHYRRDRLSCVHQL